MADIHFNCPECGAKLKVDDSVVGYQVPCPECTQTLRIPTPSDAPTPTPESSKNLLSEDEVNYLSSS